MVMGHKGLCRINEVGPRDLGRALQGGGQLPSFPVSPRLDLWLVAAVLNE